MTPGTTVTAAPSQTCLGTACDPDYLAEQIVKLVKVRARFRPVETDGAAKAGSILSELL